MAETARWTRDDHRNAYLCSDGRKVTDEQIQALGSFGAGMVRQVLDEAVAALSPQARKDDER